MMKKNKGILSSVAVFMTIAMCTENAVYIQAATTVQEQAVVDMVTDTDKDGYSDYLETTVYGTDPNVSDVSFYRWNQDYIRVNYAGNEKWKNYDGTTVSFGGSQMWFYDDTRTEEPDKSAKDYIVQNFGCGLIAASDVLLYLAQKDEKYATDRTKQVLQDENGVFDYESYVNYIYGMYQGYFRVIPNYGTNAPLFATGMGAYNMCNQLGLKIQWCHSKVKLLSRMKEMLENDIPCPLSITYNDLKGQGGVHFYDMLPTETEPYRLAVKNYKPTVSGHYVVVTGLLEDRVKNQTILEISSWGRKYYVNYEELLEHIEKYSDFMLSNITYIKK